MADLTDPEKALLQLLAMPGHPPVTPVGYWEGPLATLVRLGYATVDERKVHHITDEGRKALE